MCARPRLHKSTSWAHSDLKYTHTRSTWDHHKALCKLDAQVHWYCIHRHHRLHRCVRVPHKYHLSTCWKNSSTSISVHFVWSDHSLAGCPISAQCKISERALLLSILQSTRDTQNDKQRYLRRDRYGTSTKVEVPK